MAVDVSILMPVYNESNYLRDAIESVAMQDDDLVYEVLCVDDFSTDGTWQLMMELKKKYSFLKCYKNNEKGKNSAFNMAYRESSGKAIILLAGDDVLVENSVYARVSPILNRPDFRRVTLCKYKTFSEDKYLDGMVVPKNPKEGSLSGGTVAFDRRFAEMVFPIPTVLGNEDLWIKCHVAHSEGLDIHHVPVISLMYRLHDNNSLRRDVSFVEKNQMIAKRSIVYSVYLEKYRATLTGEAKNKLAKLAALETLRVNKCRISIIFIKGLPISEKGRALIYSNRWLHWLHVKSMRISSGWVA